MASKQCPGYNWHRLTEGYTNPIAKIARNMMKAAPIGFGHDGRGYIQKIGGEVGGGGGRSGAVVYTDMEAYHKYACILRADLVERAAQSVYVKVSLTCMKTRGFRGC